jgi:heterodisulfide reductase subunit C
MDFLPSQVIRLVQLGREEEALASQSIWLCASCEACTTRCPMDIDVAAVMDALRIMAVQSKVALGDTRCEKFNRSFLASVRRHGRVFETGMMTAYKMRCGDLMTDLDKVPNMLFKRKLPLLPKRASPAETRRVFDRAGEEDKNK